MKLMFFAALLYLGSLILPPALVPAAQAQVPSRAMNDMEAIADWSAKLNAYDVKFMETFNSPEFEALIAVLFEEDTTAAADKNALWKARVNQDVAEIRNIVATLPPPPTLTDPSTRKLQGVFQTRYDSLDTSTAQLVDMVNQLREIVDSVIGGQTEQLVDLQKLIIRSGQRMVLTENTMLTATIAPLPEDHPNYNLISTSININSMTAELMELTILYHDELYALEDRKSIVRAAEAHLPTARENLSQARRKTNVYLRNFGMASAATSNAQEKHVYGILIKMFENFQTSIATETAHVGAIEDQIELAKQDVSYLDIEAEMDALDAYMMTLVQDRITEHGQRVALMAQIQ